MIFEALKLAGAFRIRPERRPDSRGHFARTFCAREFELQGLNPTLVQCNVSYNALRGTLRGLHWQAFPHGEDKLVRVTRGSVWDVLVDLRPTSPTFRQWHGEELDEKSGTALYIPRDFAHGFVTLEDATEVFYQMGAFYEPGSARGARYDDPSFAIAWPGLEGIDALRISDRDLAFPPFR